MATTTHSGAAADLLQDRREPAVDHVSGSTYMLRYGGYLGLFVGAGLISGAVVHYPLAPLRYGIIGVVGALLFAIASVLTERRENGGSMAKVAVSSFILATGVGMVAGGIQHFPDIPDRATVLIPLGLVLSVVAFSVRQGVRPQKDHMFGIGAATAVVLLLLGMGLSMTADQLTGRAAAERAAAAAAAAGVAPPVYAAPPVAGPSDGHGHAH
jgi:hypothetical protein